MQGIINFKTDSLFSYIKEILSKEIALQRMRDFN